MIFVPYFIVGVAVVMLCTSQTGWEYGTSGFFLGFGACAAFTDILVRRLSR